MILSELTIRLPPRRVEGDRLLKESVLQTLDELVGMARGKDNAAAEGLLIEAAQRLENENITLVILGEFKRGKSTFINALLGENVNNLLQSLKWPWCCTLVRCWDFREGLALTEARTKDTMSFKGKGCNRCVKALSSGTHRTTAIWGGQTAFSRERGG